MTDIESLFTKKEFQSFDFGTGIWPIVNNNIEIKLNDDGVYENILKKEIHNFSSEELINLQETSCVFSNKNESEVAEKLFSKLTNIKHNKRIGYYLNLFAGHVIEGDFRKNASSGGFGTWIFKELFEKDYIDAVIHVKEDLTKEKLFKYDISYNLEEIQAGSKTKYYPVEMSEVLNVVKDKPGRYAVIGVPSFITELRLLCEKESVFKERIKFFIGLVCGHQKSTYFSDFLAWQCGIEPNKLEHIDYRKKNANLPATSYDIEVSGMIDGAIKTITKNTRDLYGYDWGQGFFKVRASDYTDDVMNETADLTLGDAWLQDYANDSLGNNILIVRNPLIDSLIKEASLDKRIKVDIIDEDKIISSQSGHFKHTQDELNYRLAKLEKKGTFVPRKRWGQKKQLNFVRKRVQDLRERISVNSAIYFKKAIEKNDYKYFMKKMNSLVFMYNVLYIDQRIKRKLRKVKRYIKI